MRALKAVGDRPESTAAPVPYGRMSPGIGSELRLLQRLNARRVETLSRYVGRTKAMPLLTEILRAVALAYSDERSIRIRDVVAICQAYGSARTVRTAIRTLIAAGLAVEVGHETDGRAKCLRATQRLVDLYESEIPWLRREFRRLLREFPLPSR